MFNMNDFNNFDKKDLYRSREGIFLGVCKGFSEYLGVPVLWIRVGMVVGAFVSGFFPLFVIYFLAAFFMKPAPVVPISNHEDMEFYDSYVNSRQSALLRLRDTYRKLDRRIQRIEDVVTSREFDWDRKL